MRDPTSFSCETMEESEPDKNRLIPSIYPTREWSPAQIKEFLHSHLNDKHRKFFLSDGRPVPMTWPLSFTRDEIAEAENTVIRFIHGVVDKFSCLLSSPCDRETCWCNACVYVTGRGGLFERVLECQDILAVHGVEYPKLWDHPRPAKNVCFMSSKGNTNQCK